MMKYDNFSKFVGSASGPNRFWALNENDVLDAESQLGYKFPSALREFFLQVGCGFWSKGTADEDWDRSLVNRVLSPMSITGLLLDTENPMRPRDGFANGEMPILDCGENFYLVLLPKTVQSDRVYTMSQTRVVAESTSDFFQRLECHAGFYRASEL